MKLAVIKQRGLWWIVSSLVIILGLIAAVISWQQFGAPLKPGLDFVGGTRLQLTRSCALVNGCSGDIDLAQVRQVLSDQGLGSSSLQILDPKLQILSIRTRPLSAQERTQLQGALDTEIGPFDSNSVQIDSVGPVIGRQLLSSGLLALLVSFAGIVIYLSLRFRLDYAIFAIIALFHDVLVTSGVFSILGLVAGVEVDSLFIVALLTIVGFSVNDTVVIYDRVRENIKLSPKTHINDIVDDAVNQTLTRSINTSLTTTLPLLAIVAFGGQTLKYFALALIIGFVAGAYSSIFIASSLLALWRERNGQMYGNTDEADLAAMANQEIESTR
ncbi:MAG: protein translocase subunit SecF [Cyanobacteriota bacterium]|nr:protein translocase subunit SecF [Cyanobacteriota bacterium]